MKQKNRHDPPNVQSAQEKHDSVKKKLKILGLIFVLAGGVFSLIGFIDFFTSFGTGQMPDKFWCAFIGLPLLGVGVALTTFAFKREITRYVKNESVPILNEAGKEIAPAVRDIAAAVKEGISEDSDETGSRCGCGEWNEKGSKFCKKCGKSLVRVCPHCGNEVAAESTYCNHCGLKL